MQPFQPWASVFRSWELFGARLCDRMPYSSLSMPGYRCEWRWLRRRQAEIRIGYELVEGRIQAGRVEAFSATPDDTAMEGWAIIECLGAKGTGRVYRVPVQRGSGDADSALGAFSDGVRKVFALGYPTYHS